MADIRLYAMGINEARSLYGAEATENSAVVAELRGILQRAFFPEPVAATGGRLGPLGRIMRRAPIAAPTVPEDPTQSDIDAFLTGDTIAPDRVTAAWRCLETLVAGRAWGSYRMPLTSQEVDQVDFALARGGVSASVGIRHLFSAGTEISLVPAAGLTVGWHDHDRALLMGSAFRTALGEVPQEHQEAVYGLVTWLDGFPAWAQVAHDLGRQRPDLVGFWVQ